MFYVDGDILLHCLHSKGLLPICPFIPLKKMEIMELDTVHMGFLHEQTGVS